MVTVLRDNYFMFQRHYELDFLYMNRLWFSGNFVPTAASGMNVVVAHGMAQGQEWRSCKDTLGRANAEAAVPLKRWKNCSRWGESDQSTREESPSGTVHSTIFLEYIYEFFAENFREKISKNLLITGGSYPDLDQGKKILQISWVSPLRIYCLLRILYLPAIRGPDSHIGFHSPLETVSSSSQNLLVAQVLKWDHRAAGNCLKCQWAHPFLYWTKSVWKFYNSVRQLYPCRVLINIVKPENIWRP